MLTVTRIFNAILSGFGFALLVMAILFAVALVWHFTGRVW